MGGLVTRYALGWMEQQGIDPQVRTWISFDAPHRGAVIPLGLQHWLEFFGDDSESAAFSADLAAVGLPGGRRGSMAQMDTTSVPYGDIAGDPDLMSRTTFDDVYFPSVNEDHIAITPTSAAWLMAEIRAGVTAVEDAPTMAGKLKAWPNPFNAATTFLIDVETGGKTELEIFDLRGRLVVKLLNRTLEKGRTVVSRQGRDTSGGKVPSGTYLARLTNTTTTKTQRITLLE